MDTLAKHGILVYGDYCVEVGRITQEQLDELRLLSGESLQQKLKEVFDSIPLEQKQYYGYCKADRKGRHVGYKECLNCGIDMQNFKALQDWDSCKKLNLSK